MVLLGADESACVEPAGDGTRTVRRVAVPPEKFTRLMPEPQPPLLLRDTFDNEANSSAYDDFGLNQCLSVRQSGMCRPVIYTIGGDYICAAQGPGRPCRLPRQDESVCGFRRCGLGGAVPELPAPRRGGRRTRSRRPARRRPIGGSQDRPRQLDQRKLDRPGGSWLRAAIRPPRASVGVRRRGGAHGAVQRQVGLLRVRDTDCRGPCSSRPPLPRGMRVSGDRLEIPRSTAARCTSIPAARGVPVRSTGCWPKPRTTSFPSARQRGSRGAGGGRDINTVDNLTITQLAASPLIGAAVQPPPQPTEKTIPANRRKEAHR